MLDLLSTLLVIGVLVPILYFTSHNFNHVFSIVALIMISVPTVMALIHGAPFVPTPMKKVREIVAMAKIKKGQVVYDIGCGDGRFVYVAANQYGAKATGIELSPVVYLFGKIRQFLWRSKAKIKFGNFKFYDLSDADIVFCYLLPETLKIIQPELDKQFKSGTRIYSYAFQIPHWKLIETKERSPDFKYGPIYAYQKP